MKKIWILLLAIINLVAIIAIMLLGLNGCSGTGSSITDGSATIADYAAAISASNPKSATVSITYDNTALGITLKGEYVITYNVDGTATVVYSYDKLNGIGSEDMISTVTGTVEISASGALSGSLDSTVAAAATKKINLDASKMSYVIAMGTIDASIKAADTAAVLGTALGSDAKLLMRMTSEGVIGSYSVTYNTASGPASVVCIYGY